MVVSGKVMAIDSLLEPFFPAVLTSLKIYVLSSAIQSKIWVSATGVSEPTGSTRLVVWL